MHGRGFGGHGMGRGPGRGPGMGSGMGPRHGWGMHPPMMGPMWPGMMWPSMMLLMGAFTILLYGSRPVKLRKTDVKKIEVNTGKSVEGAHLRLGGGGIDREKSVKTTIYPS